MIALNVGLRNNIGIVRFAGVDFTENCDSESADRYDLLFDLSSVPSRAWLHYFIARWRTTASTAGRFYNAAVCGGVLRIYGMSAAVFKKHNYRAVLDSAIAAANKLYADNAGHRTEIERKACAVMEKIYNPKK